MNLNNLLKHVGHHKAKIISQGVEIGVLYFNGKCKHAYNGQIYTTFEDPSILDLVISEILQDKKRKLVQFILIYHLLSKG